MEKIEKVFVPINITGTKTFFDSFINYYPIIILKILKKFFFNIFLFLKI